MNFISSPLLELAWRRKKTPEHCELI